MPDVKTWTGSTERLVRKLKTAGIVGMGYQFSNEGVQGLSSLIEEMALRLDRAVAMQLAEAPPDE